MTMNYQEFKRQVYKLCEDNSFHNKNYVDDHMVRFYNTYLFIKKKMKSKTKNHSEVKLLSIGAGGAFVEACLQHNDHFHCTVLDFPETVDINREYYDRNGFKVIGVDITQFSGDDLLDDCYDIILSLENVEHITEAPSNYMKRFIPYLKKDGLFVVSTLNMASINRIVHLLLMRPFFADPERFFSPVSFANEGIHRREYMTCEMVEEMKKIGLNNFDIKYTNYSSMFQSVSSFFQHLLSISPRFRNAFIVSGENQEVDQYKAIAIKNS